jgi:gliding motility-associated-like protein
MKKIYYFFLMINAVCAQPPGEWMWIHGNSTTNSPGNFGVQGVPSPSNVPPALYEPCEWTDLSGNYWLFGGANFASFGGTYAALWKYNPVTNQWTWMKGPNTMDYVGNYGVQGVPSPSNNPPAKSHGTASWVDLQGNLWMGFGIRVSQDYCYSDLWKYDIATNEWTWVKGPNTVNIPGTYGAQGVPNPANNPPPRWESAAAWTDSVGDLWMFGGYYFDGITFISHVYNDLWRFNIATNTWTWMKGSNVFDQPGNYGTQGVEAPANVPGARYAHCRWKGNDGKLYLFGGLDAANVGYNDLWSYNVTTNNWAWVSGSNAPNHPGSYGTKCVTNSSNLPPQRFETRSAWKDPYGNFWLFGGSNRNDLWLYCVASNQWTWISGDPVLLASGNWGTINVPSPTNKPSGRIGAVAWRDNSNHLYLFGGMNATADAFNDLWKFNIDTGNCYPCQILQQPPLLVTTTGDTSICVGSCTNISATVSSGNSPFTYTWTPNVGTGPGPHQVCPTATTTYQVIVSNGLYSDTDSVVVTVHPLPVADAGADTTICIGNSVQLNASGGTSYLWSPVTGLSNLNISNPTATPATTITYYVVASSGSCTDTDSVTITVLPQPIADAGMDVTICEGESVQLNASGGNSYSWSPSTGLSDANIPNPVASPSLTTHYVVTVYNGQCYDSDTITVTVVPLPFVDLGPDINIDKSTPVILTANTSATSFAWSPANNLSCSTCQSVTVTPDTTTTYYVTVWDNNGCIGTDSVTIFIGEEFSIYIPNVFTPNGDLINNIFYVYGINIKNLSVNIFNRWGEMIFESHDITKGWDGKYKGVPVPEGAYVYLVRFTGKEGSTEMRTGRVCLIR